MTPDGKNRQVYLEHAVRQVERGLWPTPAATDGTKAPKFHKGGNPSLPFAVKMWPTPRSTDGDHGGRVQPRKARNGGNLVEAVSMWPTPSASCIDIDTMERQRFSRTALRRRREAGEPYTTQTSGVLNPTWVEWLMGFPLGWTVCEGWGTRSSRRSPSSSGAG